jgi:hypothetical protein
MQAISPRANQHENMLPLLTMGYMQINATMRCHSMPIRKVTIKE